MTATTIVLFNRDLRVHDHPALRAAAARGRVIPLFVLDPSINAPVNRMAFLGDALRDLDASLRKLGAPLTVRNGNPAEVVAQFDADAIYASSDYTPIAARREEALGATTFPGVACVEPGAVTPVDRDHYTVFTPYWRRWEEQAAGRTVLEAPRKLVGVPGLTSDPLPDLSGPWTGGETAALALLQQLGTRTKGYADDGHDDLAGDRTSRLSPYLHFGNVSARQVMEVAAKLGADGAALIRQLCWRDFYLQFIAANPAFTQLVMLSRKKIDRTSQVALDGWKRGETGVALVDAGMRQLLAEGWMHNRTRMVTASYLVHNLGIDWWHGAAHFMEHLVDGDVANNTGNWLWVANIGLNTRPRQPMNPERQAKRFDKKGDYVRRYTDAGEQQSLLA